ncbi:hypothetical protein [Nocardia pseudobrasiliensis]|uniref:Uncharacterized protein n=1 Tax=Nocardia pseudobrasiliensis TaxID=45979 RepID=A0A370HYL0_9NOCA|nr:hypothetical protein [Nocardia pseudobrasiliensis]RDI63558.1 hypothetical protein DFR76_110255 [Nocardia pseudobrasiliensis]
MWCTAVQDMVWAQLPDPVPEAPPGSEHSAALLPYLIWIHLLATVFAVVWCVRLAGRTEGGRRRASLLAAGALTLGLATAVIGAVMGAALE